MLLSCRTPAAEMHDLLHPAPGLQRLRQVFGIALKLDDLIEIIPHFLRAFCRKAPYGQSHLRRSSICHQQIVGSGIAVSRHEKIHACVLRQLSGIAHIRVLYALTHDKQILSIGPVISHVKSQVANTKRMPLNAIAQLVVQIQHIHGHRAHGIGRLVVAVSHISIHRIFAIVGLIQIGMIEQNKLRLGIWYVDERDRFGSTESSVNLFLNEQELALTLSRRKHKLQQSIIIHCFEANACRQIVQNRHGRRCIVAGNFQILRGSICRKAKRKQRIRTKIKLPRIAETHITRFDLVKIIKHALDFDQSLCTELIGRNFVIGLLPQHSIHSKLLQQLSVKPNLLQMVPAAAGKGQLKHSRRAGSIDPAEG